MARFVRVGMLGLGGVGSAVARALLERAERLALAAGGPVVLARALVRDTARPRKVAGVNLTDSPDAVVAADDVDLVVELLGGTTPARELVSRALANGKPVVTANKELMAHHGPALVALGQVHGAELRHEASVAAAIPVVGRFEHDLAANEVLAVSGIINGTTNYILSRMGHEGVDYARALEAAQTLGYAEPDPRNDVQGHDAACKLAVLASRAFGVQVRVADVFREGIEALEPGDFAHAASLGYAIKLLAIARRAGTRVEARVHPAFVARDHPLARIDGATNAVQVEGDLAGPLVFQGRGAGPEATASAVLGDLVAVARRLHDGHPAGSVARLSAAAVVLPMDEVETRYYVRLRAADRPGVLAQIAGAFGERGVSLASVIQREPEREGDNAEVVLMTHRAREAAVRQSLGELRAHPEIAHVCTVVRVEGAEPSRAYRRGA